MLRRKWLTQGAEVAAFEREFAEALGSRHAIAVTNCTLALELVYEALGLRGREILLPSITFVACLNAAIRTGATTRLVDVTASSDLTLSLEALKRRLRPETAAVVSMPHGGMPPAMEALTALCAERRIHLIEDACHAPLATVGARPVGRFGTVATWSFFGNKNMTTGEGGMITTDDEALATRLRSLRSHGITRPTWDRAQGHAYDYDVAVSGTNARMDELRAAIGRVQLRKLPAATEQRRSALAAYRAAFAAALAEGFVLPREESVGEHFAPHIMWCLLPEGVDRQTVMMGLAAEGIQTSIHYRPLHRFTAFAPLVERDPDWAGELPVTSAIEERLLTLPLWPNMQEGVIDEVVSALIRVSRR